MPERLFRILIAAALTFTVACGGDDDDKSSNAATNNTTSPNSTSNNSTSPNTDTGDAGTGTDGGADAGDETDTGGETCGESEAFDAPLDTCVTCPNKSYICDDVVELIALDAGTATFSFEPAAGDASIVTATLGVRVNSGMTSEEFTVEGVLDGRTMNFDISDYIDSESFQLYNLVFEDSCGDSFDVIFVGNYSAGGTSNQDPYCPLGG